MNNFENVFEPQDLTIFPSYEEYIGQLNQLKKTDFSNSSLEDIGKAFFDNLMLLPHIIGVHSPERFNQLTFYRVRLNIDAEKEDLRIIRTYSYPSPAFCKENGRANLKGRCVFYCSNNPFAAIYESKPKPGDIGYLSIWKADTPRNLKIAICLPKTLRPENVWQQMAVEAHDFAKEYYKLHGKDKYRHLEALVNFIAEQFVNEKPPYPITSWISNQALYGEEGWRDFIIYPSIASNSYYSNIAFHPNVADTVLKFEKVIRFKVLEIDEPRLSLSTGRVGDIQNTNIIWRTATKEEIDFSMFP